MCFYKMSTYTNVHTINLLSNKFLIQYICTKAVPIITNNSNPVNISIYD